MGFQSMDSRGYFMLPQAPSDAGYYVYGTPRQGAGQYAHPRLLTMLLQVEREWQSQESRKFGIGNISLADGGAFKPHASHKDGLQVDVRAVRKDGKHTGVWFTDSNYDLEATRRLIAIFNAHPYVKKIFFNDSRVPGTRPRIHHNDHFHVEI